MVLRVGDKGLKDFVLPWVSGFAAVYRAFKAEIGRTSCSAS